MKLFKRIILFFGLVFILLFVFLATAVFVAANLRIKDIVEREIEQDIGIDITIEHVKFSPLLARISAQGIMIRNPAGFAEPELAYINVVHFIFDPIEVIVQRKPNIYLFAIDVERINIVRNAQKKVNIQEIVANSKIKAVSETQTPFYFDVAVISIAKVNFLDHASGKKKVSTYPVRIKNATFFDLKDGNEVARMIIAEALRHTEIGKLLHMTVVPVVTQVNNTMSAMWGATRTGAKGAFEIIALPFNLLTGR